MSDVDIFVGRKIRARRTELGKSQSQLAESVGVTFQQVQKYETGVNRVSASRLWAMARDLEVPIGFFFEGIASNVADAAIDAQGEYGSRSAHDARAMHLVRAFQTLPEPKKRAVLAIVRSMAHEGHTSHSDVQAEEA